VSHVQKREQLQFDESQKLQRLEELWQHKQQEMIWEEHRLTAEKEVRCVYCCGLCATAVKCQMSMSNVNLYSAFS